MAKAERKARFLDTLHSEEIRNNVHRVLEPLMYYSARLRRVIVVPAGFICDFETCGFLRTSNEAGTLHDYLYRIDSDPVVTRAAADALFCEALIADGNTSWMFAQAKWLAVRVGAWGLFHRKKVGV